MSLEARGLNTRNAVLIGVLLGAVLLYLLYQLFLDFSLGGNSWKQGDWLINQLSEPVRRGLFGSALLRASDVMGVSPLLLLVLLQGAVVTSIFSIVGFAVFKLGAPDKLILLLLSPGFVIFFWFNDPQGSVRKEILAYLSFLPLIVVAARGRGGLLACALSTAAYAIAMAAHEANVFFLPFLLLALWLVLPSGTTMKVRLLILVIPTLLALGGGLYASANTHVPDAGVICEQVVERGLDPKICDGAIEYLERSPDEAHMHPSRLVSTHFMNFLLLYALCLVSVRVLLQGSEHQESWLWSVIGSGLVFSPLYILAGDYGRWLNFHVTSVGLLSLVFLAKVRPAWLYQKPGRVDYACIVILSLLIGVSHSPGEPIDGFLLKLAHAIHDAM